MQKTKVLELPDQNCRCGFAVFGFLFFGWNTDVVALLPHKNMRDLELWVWICSLKLYRHMRLEIMENGDWKWNPALSCKKGPEQLWNLLALHLDSGKHSEETESDTINTGNTFNHDGWRRRVSPLGPRTLPSPTPIFGYFWINRSCPWACVHIVLNKPLASFNTNCLCPQKNRVWKENGILGD